jgi:hypothetical protein
MPAVVPSPFCPFPSCPCPSHWSRTPPSRANLPVALPSTGAPSAVGIWPPPPLSSLSYPNARSSLTSLSPSDLQGASPIVRDHRGHRSTPSQSCSSASTSLARSGGFSPSSGHPTHSPFNTAALGVSPATPRAPAH